jgi:hypothetical protein
MKLKTVLLIAAVIAAVYGLGFLFIPSTLMGLYGVKLNTPGHFVAMYFGSSLLGLAVSWWMAHNANNLKDAMKGSFLGGVVFSVSGLVVALIDGFTGTANNFVWVNTLIYIFLLASFIYLYLRKID